MHRLAFTSVHRNKPGLEISEYRTDFVGTMILCDLESVFKIYNGKEECKREWVDELQAELVGQFQSTLMMSNQFLIDSHC